MIIFQNKDDEPVEVKASSTSWIARSGSLATANPSLAAEWHPTLNTGAGPQDVTPMNGQKIWWLGSCGHQWQAVIGERASGTNCPECSRARGLVVRSARRARMNPMAAGLATEWHPTKNGDLRPEDFSAKSNRKVWWRCNTCGNEWETTVGHRSYGTVCPKCSVSCGGTLRQIRRAQKNPISSELASEWHPEKNGNLCPEDFSTKSNRKVWWRCEYGHEWQAVINDRTSGHSCRRCHGGSQTSLVEAVAFFELSRFWEAEWRSRITGASGTTHEADVSLPEQHIAVKVDGGYWHSNTKSRDIAKDRDLMAVGWRVIRLRNRALPPLSDGAIELTGAGRYLGPADVWLLLQALHSLYPSEPLQQYIDRHTLEALDEARLEYDRMRKGLVQHSKSLLVCAPDVAREWHPTKNGILLPGDVSPGSERKVWWRCEHGHEWEAYIHNRSRGIGCEICAKRTRPFAKQRHHAKKNPMAAGLTNEWHPTKNGDLRPEDFSAKSNRKVWWCCEHGHEWESAVSSREAGFGCPECGYKKQGITYRLGRDRRNPMSLELAAEWHPTKNGNLRPEDFSAKSNRKVWWLCKHGHEWESRTAERTTGARCPFCRSLARAFRNPMSLELAAEWHPTKNGDLRPEDFSAKSNRKAWWHCGKCGGDWEAMVANRSIGHGCPHCRQSPTDIKEAVAKLD